MVYKKRILIGIIYFVIGAILYGLFHDVSRIFVLRNLSQTNLFNVYRQVQGGFYEYFSKVPFYLYIQSYLINFLFILSFCLTFFTIIQGRVKFAVVAIISLAIELGQLIDKRFGTFDFVDILIYMLVILVFYYLEERKKLKEKS